MGEQHSCCAGVRAKVQLGEADPKDHQDSLSEGQYHDQSQFELHSNMITIPGGTFTMGTNSHEGFPRDGEGPARGVTVSGFEISPYAVTNEQFQRFVEATGYVTEAEHFGWSFVFELLASEETKARVAQVPQEVPWWLVVEGAYWARTRGRIRASKTE